MIFFFFQHEIGQTLEQVTHSVCGVTITRDTQNTTGHASVHPAVTDPSQTERLD